MKNILKIIIILSLTIGINNIVYGQINKVMTYNIRYDNSNDGVNKWDDRKVEVINLIRYYEPEIFGIQEGLINQVKYLDQNLSNYSRVGVGRDDGKEKGEFSAIYYNKEKISLVKTSTFWLSETSKVPSIGWDASMERICTYGLFEIRSNNQKILIFNTHYDHVGKKARIKSSKLILKKINEINEAGDPVILMGDFNSEPNSKPIKVILREFEDGARLTKNGIYGSDGTFTGFVENKIAKRRIDYIFTKKLNVVNYRHIDDKRKNNHYLSDHLPVLVKLN